LRNEPNTDRTELRNEPNTGRGRNCETNPTRAEDRISKRTQRAGRQKLRNEPNAGPGQNSDAHFRNTREAGAGEKSLKVSHGFSLILTAREHRERAKTQFGLELTSGDSLAKGARARDLPKWTVYGCCQWSVVSGRAFESWRDSELGRMGSLVWPLDESCFGDCCGR
jgi:hypothetical protein